MIGRRGFFSAMFAAPVVAMAKPVENRVINYHPVVVRSTKTDEVLIHDAMVRLGLIRPGECLCSNDMEFCKRILAEMSNGRLRVTSASLAIELRSSYNIKKPQHEAIISTLYCKCGGALMAERDENYVHYLKCTMPECPRFGVWFEQPMVGVKQVSEAKRRELQSVEDRRIEQDQRYREESQKRIEQHAQSYERAIDLLNSDGISRRVTINGHFS